MKNRDVTIIIKGAGEMATGIAHRLYMANFKRILMTEIEKPISVRRFVAFSEAVYENTMTVEGVTAELIKGLKEIDGVWDKERIGVIVDPDWRVVGMLRPHIVIDAIMAKRNSGTKKDEAPIVIGVGPGFCAPHDCHAVVESNRGHNLGRVIYRGSAEPHTGIPGPVMGLTKERVLRSSNAGFVRHVKSLGDEVKKGDIVMYVDDNPVIADIDGILRGQIREIYVTENEKIGDIDPRGKKEYCFTISEKARAIGGGVLEAIMHFL
ncbi:MAG TPA: selenium-dependent molybdenum cofactor biosynthesis protein YqeB [Syntrophorhabdaceae bacterium]|nr:selenium-dependent molybdenum cofactor biosynthesis protein YqeB [Syntrophorhabdaceae bacterium]